MHDGKHIIRERCGPGCHLKSIFSLFFIKPEPGCLCHARAHHMDLMGCRWCRENVEVITDWLEEEAADRKLPFVRIIAKRLVLIAIWRAEKKKPA